MQPEFALLIHLIPSYCTARICVHSLSLPQEIFVWISFAQNGGITPVCLLQKKNSPASVLVLQLRRSILVISRLLLRQERMIEAVHDIRTMRSSVAAGPCQADVTL